MFSVANGQRPGIPGVLIVIADGNSEDGVNTVKDRSQNVIDRGISVIAVGVTDRVNIEGLYAMTADRDDVVIVGNLETDLSDKRYDVLNRMCTNYEKWFSGAESQSHPGKLSLLLIVILAPFYTM